MSDRICWFIIVYDNDDPSILGIGECAPIPELSRDRDPGIENMISWVCNHINDNNLLDHPDFWSFPSLLFGTETALIDLKSG